MRPYKGRLSLIQRPLIKQNFSIKGRFTISIARATICSMNRLRANKIRQTFTLPAEVFQRFSALVPEGMRSAVIASLIEQEASRREQALASACEAANEQAGLVALQEDLQALEDTVSEPFDAHAW